MDVKRGHKQLVIVKVDSHILRYDAARHEEVRQDAAKTHGCCSHMQRLPL